MAKKQKVLRLSEITKLMQGKGVSQIKKSVCGKLIGYGLYRDVYEIKHNPKYVIKIERDMSRGNFANVTEFRNWIDNRDWKFLAEWLAPCELINETGQILIQRRVIHKRRKDYPKYIPFVFTDLKLANFGWIGNKFVCCDYSYFPVTWVPKGKKSMVYAKWWGTLKHLKK